jgi:hypothetical protein
LIEIESADMDAPPSPTEYDPEAVIAMFPEPTPPPLTLIDPSGDMEKPMDAPGDPDFADSFIWPVDMLYFRPSQLGNELIA